MRIVFFGNNWLGWQVARWLRERGETIVGAVLHPPRRRRFGEELLDVLGLDAFRVFDGSRLKDPALADGLRGLQPDIGVSVLFGYIIPGQVLRLFPQGAVNLHPALLPYNRGAHPNVWSIVDGTPAGVTLHYMDDGVDTGDVIAQHRVEVEPVDTGATLYRRLERAAVALFTDAWPAIRSGQVRRVAQSPGTGTFHRVADLAQIDRIRLDETYPARRLIDIIRARTFPPYPGAYFEEGGRRVYLRLTLLGEDELDEPTGEDR